MEFVVGEVVKTTTTIGSDDGDAENHVAAGSLAVIHESPCDNNGMYSIAVGTTVYDVELWEIERIDHKTRNTQEVVVESQQQETLWLKGVQVWLQSGCATKACPDDSIVAALDFLQRSLDVLSPNVPDFMLAKRELFCAVLLHELRSHESAVPHFERALSLILKYLSRANGSNIEEDCARLLEVAFREYADALERMGDIQQGREVAMRAVKCGILWSSYWQRPNFLLAGLEAMPFWRPDEKWVGELEANTAVVFDELSSLLQHDVWRRETRPHALAHGSWQERVLFGTGGQPELAPKTAALVQKLLPSAVDLCQSGAGEVLFSVLGPHTHVSPHCGPHNLRLTAHLGLLVPPSHLGRCALRVQETWMEWQEGKVLIFDDSFEHEVVNETSQTRIVLLMRYWHPSLQNDSARQLQALEQFREQGESRAKFKAIPPVGSSELQMRLSGTTQCAQCKKGDQDIAIHFVWEGEPHLTAKCVCGFELTSCSNIGSRADAKVECSQPEEPTLCFSEMD